MTALQKSQYISKIELALADIEREIIELEQFPGEWSTQQEIRHEELLQEQRSLEGEFCDLVEVLA
jgi:hypothetical protein